jgi:hypothetical protein
MGSSMSPNQIGKSRGFAQEDRVREREAAEVGLAQAAGEQDRRYEVRGRDIIIWSATALGTLPGDRCTPDRFAIGSANAETAVDVAFTMPQQIYKY